MLTKNKIQSIKNLHEKSGRHESGLFLVEWRKGIVEFMESDFEIVEGFFTDKFTVPTGVDFPYEIVSERDLERISTLSSNRDGLLIVRMKKEVTWQQKNWLTLILDGINDPGNLGTIIRTADWYGISRIICSLDTVDCYNPKVLMATMGSFTRVYVEYCDLEEYLVSVSSVPVIPGLTRDPVDKRDSLEMTGFLPSQEWQKQQNQKIYWAYLDGESTHTKEFVPAWGYLIIGSESHGIRPHLEKYITDKITIPRFGLAESLNAGVATAVILDRMSGI
jgi:TrmH family RNA methyltransferase